MESMLQQEELSESLGSFFLQCQDKATNYLHRRAKPSPTWTLRDLAGFLSQISSLELEAGGFWCSNHPLCGYDMITQVTKTKQKCRKLTMADLERYHLREVIVPSKKRLSTPQSSWHAWGKDRATCVTSFIPPSQTYLLASRKHLTVQVER